MQNKVRLHVFVFVFESASFKLLHISTESSFQVIIKTEKKGKENQQL